jgi:hypothetical protein
MDSETAKLQGATGSETGGGDRLGASLSAVADSGDAFAAGGCGAGLGSGTGG